MAVRGRSASNLVWMPEVLTRAAIREDAAALTNLAASLGQELSVSDFEQALDRHAESFFVAEVDGEIAGYVILRTEPAPPCVPGIFPIQLWRLYVETAHQGKGVARSLMGKAFVHAHSRRHDALWLGTDRRNGRAIAFYEKCGLYTMGEIRLHGEAASQDLIMGCTLG